MIGLLLWDLLLWEPGGCFGGETVLWDVGAMEQMAFQEVALGVVLEAGVLKAGQSQALAGESLGLK
jgi:hypothetical protein